MGQWFRRKEMEKLLGRGGGKGGFPGRVVFYSGCVKDKSWG